MKCVQDVVEAEICVEMTHLQFKITVETDFNQSVNWKVIPVKRLQKYQPHRVPEHIGTPPHHSLMSNAICKEMGCWRQALQYMNSKPAVIM